MITTRETFNKSERLCSRKIITGLFETGNIFYTHFFKILWAKTDIKSSFPAQVAFIVPKRGFRHAITRNLLKRRMREAYRKNKNLLYEFLYSQNIKIAFIVIFRSDKVADYRSLETEIKEMLNKIKTEVRSEISKC